MNVLKTTLAALRIFLLIAGAVTLGFFIYSGFSPGTFYGMMHGAWFPLHAFGMVVFWGLVLTVVVTIFKTSYEKTPEDTTEVAERRYARGEIDKETYLEIKRTLDERR